jgi:hypothetical protein
MNGRLGTAMNQLMTVGAIRERAAAALDVTHEPALAYRGPRTMSARARLALWLDTGRWYRTLRADLNWLEQVAAEVA